MAKTIDALIMEFFMNRPNTEFRHAPVDEWVTEQYTEETGDPSQDVRRQVRELVAQGRLRRVRPGVFIYDPKHEHEVELLDFPESVKQAIFERDGFKCVACGRGEKDGVRLAADHIKPRSELGTNDI